jgi:hypothetical protein
MSANKVTVGLLVHLEAKPGKEAEVEQFLKSGLAVVQGEPATITWYAIRLSATTFGIFDTFPDNAGRDAPSGPRRRIQRSFVSRAARGCPWSAQARPLD